MKTRRSVSSFLLMAVLLAAASTLEVLAQEAGEGWRAYFTGKKGDEKPFPTDPKEKAKIKDKDWLKVGYTEYAGYKPRVGVFPDEIKPVEQQQYQSEVLRFLEGWGARKDKSGPSPFEEVEGMVRQAMGATNRFSMTERTTAMADVLDEQDFGAGDRVDQKTKAKKGVMKGVEFAVKVKLLEFNPEKESKDIKMIGGGIGASTMGIGSFGVSGKVAYCRLNVRVIDAATGTIVQDLTVDGTAAGHGAGFGAGMIKGLTKGIVGGGVSMNTETQASLTEAIQVAANKVAYGVSHKFVDLPWQGSVLAVSDGAVRINAGTNVGMKEGLVLKLFTKGEEMIDPETNESLGFDISDLGELRVTKVLEKFSTCEIVSGGQGVKVGDIVRLERAKK